METGRLDHIGIVVRDLDEAASALQRAFGTTREDVADPGGGRLRIAFVQFQLREVDLI